MEYKESEKLIIEAPVSQRTRFVIDLITATMSGALWASDVLHNGIERTVLWALAALCIYISGRAADKLMTARGIKLMETNVGVLVEEGNRELPEHPQKSDLFKPKVLAYEIGAGITGLVAPPVAISLGINGFTAAASNYLLCRKIENHLRNAPSD